METSLHRELKSIYAGDSAQTEVVLGRYRIDAINDDELIEIQHGSLASIRRKISTLVKKHRVRVVKPIIQRKRLIKRAGKGRRVIDRRMSPKRGSILDLFHELVYFCRVFPHRNLTLEVPLVEVEEWRFPGHGKRRRHRERDHQVEDQRLVQVGEVHEFKTAKDMLRLVPAELPKPFDTKQLAESLQIDRWFAQRIAYCLRETKAIRNVGKTGNALLYEPVSRARR